MVRRAAFILIAAVLPCLWLVGCPGKSSPTSPNPTRTPTAVATLTATQTLVSTSTATSTLSSTASSTSTSTQVPTSTFTPTSTSSATATHTSTRTGTASSTSSPTTTSTLTPTPTGSWTLTSTPSLTSSPTSTETPLCAPIHLGFDDDSEVDGGNFAEYLIHAAAVTLGSPATVMGLRLKMSAPYGNMRAGIYADNGNKPGILQTQSDAQYVYSTGITWVHFDFPDQALTPGTYWLAFNAEYVLTSSAWVYGAQTGGTRVFASHSISPGTVPPFPASFPDPNPTLFTDRLLFHADICLAPGIPTFTPTPTRTPSPTATVTLTPTRTETPLCTPIHLGYDDDSETNSSGFSEYRLYASAITLGSPATVMSLALKMFNPYGYVKAAVYDDAAGVPSALRAESEAYYVTPSGDVWVNFDFPDLALTPGTYWLAFNAEYIAASNASVYYAPDGGTRVFADHSPGNLPSFPASFPAPQGTNSSRLLFYANLCLGAGVPTPTPTSTRTSTPSPTVTASPTSTETPLCSPSHLGYDNDSEVDGAGFTEYIIHASAVTLGSPATVMGLHLRMSAPYGYLRGAIYTDNGNKPGSLEIQSEAQYVYSAGATWVHFDFPDAPLGPGVHWLAFNAEYISAPSAWVYGSFTGGARVFASYPPSPGTVPPFPASFPDPNPTVQSDNIVFYADICPGD